MTPVNIAFWGGLYAPAQPILRQVAVNPLEMFLHVLLLLGVPLAAGCPCRGAGRVSLRGRARR